MGCVLFCCGGGHAGAVVNGEELDVFGGVVLLLEEGVDFVVF